MFVKNLAYEASAGSGKTFMLVVRYLSLLFLGAQPAKILALTFTNKAAAEMSERVVETLEKLEERGELAEILKVTGLSKEEILSRKKEVLHSFLNANTKIMTIDSFFTKILRKFSLYAGLMPDFSTASSQHELKLLERFLKQVSVEPLKKRQLVNLALESNKRLQNLFGLLNELYEKSDELSHLKFEPTYTKGYEERAMEALRNIQNIVSTCKGASDKLKTTLQSAQSFEDILRSTWAYKETLNYWVFKKCYTPQMDENLGVIHNAIREHFRHTEQNFFASLFALVKSYKDAKKVLYREDSELSFSDVTILVYEILHTLDDSEFLYFRLDSTIEHILLDEFQDTSIMQYKILNPLISEITSGEGICKEGSFFFVGDVKQSIYRFRGGVSALFDEVAKEHATQVEKLKVNYRSKANVVEFVNDVFVNKIKNYTPQEVQESAEGGYVAIKESEELLEDLLQEVQSFISQGANVDEIAVLCATNADGEEVKNLLASKGIEVVTETTTKLINQQSVKAVLEYLKYCYFQEEIYKENFFALIGRKSAPLHVKHIDKNNLVATVRKLIEEYRLFGDDFHLLRFLSALRGYKDIEALLFEYERLEMAAAPSDLSGVRVLTIHKSKGLEYEHVIVLDRLKKAPANRDAIIYEYEGIGLQNIYLRQKNRELLDAEYHNAMEKEKRLIEEDTLNALYVAFTRARDNLVVLQKEKGSMFALLELETQQRGLFTCKAEQRAAEPKRSPLEYKELYYGSQEDILAQEKQRETDLEAVTFGLATHYTLEMLEQFEERFVEEALHMTQNRYGFELSAEKLREIEKRVLMLLQEKEFLSLVDGECFREKGFKYKNNLRYIDLLVRHSDKWVVIDYKTGEEHHEEYLKQVRSYMHAVEQLTGERVEGYLCYLLSDAVKLVAL